MILAIVEVGRIAEGKLYGTELLRGHHFLGESRRLIGTRTERSHKTIVDVVECPDDAARLEVLAGWLDAKKEATDSPITNKGGPAEKPSRE